MLTRGTTPTIRYTFSKVSVSDITAAYLTIKPAKGTAIERDLTTAAVDDNALEWQLTQEETLQLEATKEVNLQLRYKTSSGDAYATVITTEKTGRILKDGVI